MNNDEINAGLDALQHSIEKRISGDLKVLEDSDELLRLSKWLHSAAVNDDQIMAWSSLILRIAIPRPVGGGG